MPRRVKKAIKKAVRGNVGGWKYMGEQSRRPKKRITETRRAASTKKAVRITGSRRAAPITGTRRAAPAKKAKSPSKRPFQATRDMFSRLDPPAGTQIKNRVKQGAKKTLGAYTKATNWSAEKIQKALTQSSSRRSPRRRRR